MTPRNANENEAAQQDGPFRVGEWRVEPASDRLLKEDQEVRVEPRVMDLLVCLASRPGEVLSRQELEDRVWADMVVGYDSLTSTVIKLRKALGDSSKNPSYIETISKRGYRLIAPVSPLGDQPTPLPSTGRAPNASPDKDASAAMQARRAYLFVAAAIVVLAVGGIYGAYRFTRDTGPDIALQPEQGRGRPAIAVLPFINLSNDPKQEYFSDGITDDLITDLSRYSGLLVISRRSAFIYKTRSVDLQSLADELGVRYVVEGSVRLRPEANQLRVNVQLVDAQTGINIWAQRFDRRTEDIFEVQDDIRDRIIDALAVKLTEEERQRERRRYTDNFEAYDYFLRAQYSLIRRSSAKDYEQTRKLLNKAIALDAQFARAYAALALAHADAYRFGWTETPKQTARAAVETGKHALELDPQLPQTHWVLGYIYLFLLGDHERAIEMGERTVELDANNADGYTLLAVTYAHAGQPQHALRLTEHVKTLNPHYPSQVPSIIGLSHLKLKNYAKSLAAYDESLLINATRLQSLVYKVIVLVRMNRLDDARWARDQLYSMHTDFDIHGWITRQPHKDHEFSQGLLRDFLQASPA